jgi:hypothetical protein
MSLRSRTNLSYDNNNNNNNNNHDDSKYDSDGNSILPSLSGRGSALPDGSLSLSGTGVPMPDGSSLSLSGGGSAPPDGSSSLSGHGVSMADGSLSLSGRGSALPDGSLSLSGLGISRLDGSSSLSGVGVPLPDGFPPLPAAPPRVANNNNNNTPPNNNNNFHFPGAGFNGHRGSTMCPLTLAQLCLIPGVHPMSACPVCESQHGSQYYVYQHVIPAQQAISNPFTNFPDRVPSRPPQGLAVDKIIAAVNKAAEDLPPFKTGDPKRAVFSLLNKIEEMLVINESIPREYYVNALYKCLKGDDLAQKWLTQHVLLTPRLPWEEVRLRFSKQFEKVDYQARIEREYHALAMGPSEEVQAYESRVSEVLVQLKRNVDSEGVIAHLLNTLTYYYRHKILQRQQTIKAVMRVTHTFTSIDELFEWCRDIEYDKLQASAISTVNGATAGEARHHTAVKSKSTAGGNNTFNCSYHRIGVVDHNSVDCPVLHQRNRATALDTSRDRPAGGNAVGSRVLVHTRTGATIICHNCGGNHYRDKCTTPRVGSANGATGVNNGSINAASSGTNMFANRLAQHKQTPANGYNNGSNGATGITNGATGIGGPPSTRSIFMVCDAGPDPNVDVDAEARHDAYDEYTDLLAMEAEESTFEGDPNTSYVSDTFLVGTSVYATSAECPTRGGLYRGLPSAVFNEPSDKSTNSDPTHNKKKVTAVISGTDIVWKCLVDSGCSHLMMNQATADRCKLVYKRDPRYGGIKVANGKLDPHPGAVEVEQITFSFEKSIYNLSPVTLSNIKIEVMDMGDNPFDMLVAKDYMEQLLGPNVVSMYGADWKDTPSTTPTVASVINSSVHLVQALHSDGATGHYSTEQWARPMSTTHTGGIEEAYLMLDKFDATNTVNTGSGVISGVNQVTVEYASTVSRFGMYEDAPSPFTEDYCSNSDGSISSVNSVYHSDDLTTSSSGVSIPFSDLTDEMQAAALTLDTPGYEFPVPLDEVPVRPHAYTTAEKEAEFKSLRKQVLEDPGFMRECHINSLITGFCNRPDSVLLVKVDEKGEGKMCTRQYPIPHTMRPHITRHVQDTLAAGIIELCPPGNAFNLPMFVVPKKDDQGNMLGVRPVLDCRGINMNIITTDKFEIPLIGHSLEIMAGKKIFAEFDLQSAFFQFILHPDCRKYFAFTWEGVQYQYVGCPFGIDLLPSHFQRVMSSVVQGLNFVFPYIDNLPIGSDTWDQHTRHCTLLVERLNSFNLKIKPSSIKVGQSHMQLLGHKVSAGGIGIADEKLETISKWEFPPTPRALASFIGFIVFVRNNVRHASELLAPLEAVKNNKEFAAVDSGEYKLLQRAFEAVKLAVSKSITLTFPKPNHRLVICCDASNAGMGGVLYQVPSDSVGDEHTADNIIAFCSKKWTLTESHYSTYKKETKALVWCLTQFHTYIWGRRDTVVYTDHKPLVYMFKSTTLSNSLQLWLDIIQMYHFRVEHRPGVLNVVADQLSRMYTEMYSSGPYWGLPNGNIAEIISKYSTNDLGEEVPVVTPTVAVVEVTFTTGRLNAYANVVTRSNSSNGATSAGTSITVSGTGVTIPEWSEPGDDELLLDSLEAARMAQAIAINMSLCEEEGERVYVDTSLIPGAGDGLFALYDIPYSYKSSSLTLKSKQATIIKYRGVIKDSAVDGYAEDQTYQMHLSGSRYIDAKVECLSGLARHINSACPGFPANVKFTHSTSTDEVVVKPLRKITAREELYADYGRDNRAFAVTRSGSTTTTIPTSEITLVAAPADITAGEAEEIDSMANKLERILKHGDPRLVTSEEEQREITHMAHLRGHTGEAKMLSYIKQEGVYWPRMIITVKEEIANCNACCSYTVVKRGFAPAKSVSASTPFDHIQIDCCVHLPRTEAGFTTLLVIVDVFTRYVILRPVLTTSAVCIANALVQVFCDYGVPKIVQSDNGVEFSNEMMRAMGRVMGFEHRLITPYHPAADGLVENTVGSTMNVIKKMVLGRSDLWYAFVSYVQLMHNNKVASLTGSTPFSLMFGRSLNDFKDYTGAGTLSNVNGATGNSVDRVSWEERIIKMVGIVWPGISKKAGLGQDKMIKRLDASRNVTLPANIATGSTVFIRDVTRTNKFEPTYVGPYTVDRIGRNGQYWVRDQTGDMLGRAVTREHIKVIRGKAKAGRGEEVYLVEAIRDHRSDPSVSGEYEYLVKWREFPETDNSWEAAHRFQDVRVIQDYWKARGKANSNK